jgi:ethanolamine-phosphate cytidylyltransferase
VLLTKSPTGHANAFRQARALGDQLVVGVNTDADIIKYKGGPPIMNDAERVAAVAGCRFVDQVVPGAPYEMTEEYLQFLFDEHKIDYVVHGDDACLTPDGRDVFAAAKRTGRFRTVKRTEGVSTTDLVGRMLLMNRDHHRAAQGSVDVLDSTHSAFQRASAFLPTSRRFTQFATQKQPKPGDRVVYVDGTWDLFHAGHIEFLEQCRKQGDFLLVGVHSDDTANLKHGANYPIMNLHERVLSVLSCKHVDDVVFGAPWKITKDLLVTFNVAVVCKGRVQDAEPARADLEDPYELPRAQGLLRVLDSPSTLKSAEIVGRIMQQRAEYERKFEKKSKSEAQYNQDKVFVEEL